MIGYRAGLALLLLALAAAPACADDPVLAPGRDPGGLAVAVLSDGFDYTRSEVAHVLARDGEGEAVTWDAVDDDHRPFALGGRGTDTALAAAARGGARIVAVRVAPRNPASLAQGVVFAASTPARVVLVAFSDQDRRGLDVMVAAAERFDGLLFVVSVPGPTAEETKAVKDVANLIVLDSRESVHAAAKAVAHVLGCKRDPPDGASGAELGRVFLDRLGEPSPASCAPEGGETE